MFDSKQELKFSVLECIDNFHVELERRTTSMCNVYEQLAAVHSKNLIYSNDETITTYIHLFSAIFNDLEQ